MHLWLTECSLSASGKQLETELQRGGGSGCGVPRFPSQGAMISAESSVPRARWKASPDEKGLAEVGNSLWSFQRINIPLCFHFAAAECSLWSLSPRPQPGRQQGCSLSWFMGWEPPQSPFVPLLPSVLCPETCSSCQARLERRGGREVLSYSQGRVFLHPWKCWAGKGVGDPGAGLRVVQNGTGCPVSPVLVPHMEWCHEMPLLCTAEKPCAASGIGPSLAQCIRAFTSACLLHLAAISSFYYTRGSRNRKKTPWYGFGSNKITAQLSLRKSSFGRSLSLSIKSTCFLLP